MKGEILSVGTELLLGQLVDTNAPWLAQELSGLGIDVYWISQVGDNQERLVQAMRQGWERSDLIVISGGLGPTGDDLTREAIAELLGEQMVVQPDLEAQLRAFFARRNRPMPDRNVKQSTLIPSANALSNPIGTAPGWWIEKGGRVIAAMPGVPVEMKRMWQHEVAPRLGGLAGGGVILSRTVKTLGIGESQVETQLLSLTGASNPTVATYAKEDGVHVRISAKASTTGAAMELISEAEATVRRILGDHVYGVDEESVADAVGGLLRRHGHTLATLEAATAGQLSATLTASSVASERFLGGLVAYRPGLAERFGIDPALVASSSRDGEGLVRAMATAVRSTARAGVGLAVACEMEDGAAGGQHLGIVHTAVDDGTEVVSATTRYSTTPMEVRRRAVLDAMDLLRRRLLSA